LRASKATRALNSALNVRLFLFMVLWILPPRQPAHTSFIPWLRLGGPPHMLLRAGVWFFTAKWQANEQRQPTFFLKLRIPEGWL